ncbi:LLM class flavin-dependent oxidoreductase [Kitasatospora sp. NPDC057015]|uniref:LLM class flavin-dependent oxidoreductase n=1 Tax=Kitasatospora sp. NPDC057015 TaxID=3346001 RepID=UPI003636ED99
MDDEMRVGVVLPTGAAQWDGAGGPRGLIGFGARAEEFGFDSLWAGDTLLKPMLDPLALLGALAARTERVTLGTAALLPAFRRPVQTARALASLDLLSAGRLVVTVGAGFPNRSEREYAVSEVPWERRFGRLDETVALWRRLWTATGPSDFHGKVLHFDDLPQGLAPHRPGGPPVWLGGATPAALARTGRLYDGWLPYPPDHRDYRPGLADVRAAATGAGREAAAITPALYCTVLVTPGREGGREGLDAFCRATYGVPLEVAETIQCLVAGPAEEVARRLRAYSAAGARHLVCRLGVADARGQAEQLERLAGLLPVLRGLG